MQYRRVREDISYGDLRWEIADITYMSELTLDIKDVKGQIRTFREVKHRRFSYVICGMT